ncbi:50S ribosomal protein L29 [Candidatus Micrarchaeota archaeon]|nr:50S ribosomal protein L29 [Candidatus Micrarchaeota archaeon]
MVVKRLKELRASSTPEVLKTLGEIEQEIITEYGALKTSGKPANSGRYRELKRLRARIKTILNQRKHKI